MIDEDLEDKLDVRLNGRMMPPVLRYFEKSITQKLCKQIPVSE